MYDTFIFYVSMRRRISFASYLLDVCSLKRESRRNIEVDSIIQFVYSILVLISTLEMIRWWDIYLPEMVGERKYA